MRHLFTKLATAACLFLVAGATSGRADSSLLYGRVEIDFVSEVVKTSDGLARLWTVFLRGQRGHNSVGNDIICLNEGDELSLGLVANVSIPLLEDEEWNSIEIVAPSLIKITGVEILSSTPTFVQFLSSEPRFMDPPQVICQSFDNSGVASSPKAIGRPSQSDRDQQL